MYKPEIVEIAEIKKQTEEVSLIKVNKKLDYYPGQFVHVSVLGIGEAPISICSYSEDCIELSVEDVGGVTKALCRLKKGDKIGIRGPYGYGYPMMLFKGNSIIMIGGGCGVAPMRSVIEYVEKNRADFEDLFIFFGFRTPQEIIFKDEIEKWEKEFKCYISVDTGDKNWKGNVGFVTQSLEKTELNNDRKIVFICGPPRMIKFVLEILKKKGFNDDQIFVSYERQMKCGIGKCGHCMINGKYVCKDGPVFRYDEVKDFND